jgi:ribosome biogenesis GTPase
MDLTTFGFTAFFQAQLTPADAITVGRVLTEEKKAYRVITTQGELVCDLAGRFYHHAKSRLDFPTVGDFVTLKARVSEGKGTLQRVLTRRTLLSRAMGEGDRTGDVQTLAANVDTVFLVTSLNLNFNLRRLERFLALVQQSGALPVILLTKSDLMADAAEIAGVMQEVQRVAAGVAMHAISCLENKGLEALIPYFGVGKTAVVLGSSGVGKSTLVNHLAQADLQDMMETRELDDKGRHCTSSRMLIPLPGPYWGMIIDTPGLRGLNLSEAEPGSAGATNFDDIVELATACKFSDCLHITEPGCAIKTAIEAGTLDPARLASYAKLGREQASANAKAKLRDRRKETKAAKAAGK